jgi:hypothetical protein
MSVAEHRFATLTNIILFLLLMCFVLFLHGAIPFLAVPTLGQAVWTAGFGQSFVNPSGFSIFAANFGLPHPSAIAFGLSGALPVGLFISMGLHPADAYAAMAAMWLAVGFYYAWRLAMLFEFRFFPAFLAAVLWMSMPIIWAHAGYSMLSLGIALLPFYFFVAIVFLTKFLKFRS